jgi:hypothetical protein
MYYDRDTLIRWIDTTGKELLVKSVTGEAQSKRDDILARILVDCARISGPAQSCDFARGDST